MSDRDAGVARRGLYLEYATVAWCVVEAGVALWSGVVAGSIALVGFGADSIIEILAALVVIWQLRGVSDDRTRAALRWIAVSFFLLAAYVLGESMRTLVTRTEPAPSAVGIAVTAASVVIMPLLAWGKRRVGRALENPVLLADSVESALCALFSASALLGLTLNAAVGWWWADPAAAIVIALLAAREGREAWEDSASDV